jgi:alpha-N-arabinofuranosidase
MSVALQACGGSGSGEQTSSPAASAAATSTVDSASPSSSSSSSSSGGASTNPDVFVQVDASTSGPAVNRLVLGTNVEWVDSGDNLLRWNTLSFDPNMVSLVQSMGPTVLRYPGGNQADVYDWSQGVGPLSARGSNVQAPSKQSQITYMGTGELLQLSQTTGAIPLITVNVVTGTAAEAAAWVRQTNVTGLQNAAGQALPRVVYWEIGNEPYYTDPSNPQSGTCQVDPLTYASRINAYAAAMRTVDPTIKIGIALSSEEYNGIQVVPAPCKNYAVRVLNNLTQSIDFVSLHDAYLPYAIAVADLPASEEYYAAMGATQSIQTDFVAMRNLLQAFAGVQSVPFAITEYNALFSFNSGSPYYHSMASPMGALFIADALRFFASRDDVLIANAWSLSANDHWGAIHGPTASRNPYGRPDYFVFSLFSEAMQGVRLTASVQSPTFNSPSFGFSAAATQLPLVTSLVTMNGSAPSPQTLRILLINKDYTGFHIASVTISNASVSSAHMSLLTAPNVLQTNDLPGAMVRSESDLSTASGVQATLPPHSVALLTVQLAAASP